MIAVPAAVTFALCGMTGAGVFVGPALAAGFAGAWLLPAIPLAAVVALLCCLGMIVQRCSGQRLGYAGVRWELGVVPGRISASLSLVGQGAAMAAIAGAIGQYALPSAARGVAAVAALLAALAASVGVRPRGVAGRAWAGLTLVVLAVVVATCFAIPPAPVVTVGPAAPGLLGMGGAAGAMVFAYLGFERITEHPGEDRKALFRVALLTVVVATVVVLAVSGALLYQLGAARLALSPAPVVDALGAAAAANVVPLIRVGAVVVMVPALLTALEAFRSTGRAVVADGDLPKRLHRTGRAGTPYLLDLCGGVFAALLAQFAGPEQAIELAACCVLMHQALLNLSVQRSLTSAKWWARGVCAGMILAIVLAMTMPAVILFATLAVVIAGPVIGRAISGYWR
jgi:APA family basic amino acid/polyamine antiporter